MGGLEGKKASGRMRTVFFLTPFMERDSPEVARGLSNEMVRI